MADMTLQRARSALKILSLRPFDTSTEDGRARERFRRVFWSAFASATAKAISISTTLITIPLTLHYLGAERYGMWMTMSALIAMLSFADLGIGNGLINAVASAHGSDDRCAIQRYISSAFFLLTVIAASVIVIFGCTYPYVPWFTIFNVRDELARQEAGPALAVLVTCFALMIPAGIVQRTQMGLQRGFLASMWQCIASVVGLIGVLISIWFEAGLPWLVFSLVGAPLAVSMLNGLLFFSHVYPDIAPKLNAVSRDAMKHVAHTGLLFLILQIAGAITFTSDNLIIAHFLGASAVTQYAVPEKLFSVISFGLSIALMPLWPAYSEAIARGDLLWVRTTFRRSFLTVIGLSALFSGIMIVASPSIIKFWVGNTVTPPFLLLFGLGLWKTLEAGGNAMAVLLNGAHVMKAQVVISLLTAAAVLTLKIIFVDKFGISAVVWSTLLPYLFITMIPYLFVLQQYFAPRTSTPTQ